jgi:O-Antigen ligase
LAFAVSTAEAASSRAVTRGAVRDAILGAPIATTIWLASRSHGAYEIGAWAPLGLLLLAALLVLCIAGRHLSLRAAAPAAALLTLGVWAAVSGIWGGVADAGWTTLDQLIVAGAALTLGAMLAAATSPRVIQTAVLIGITAHGIELLARLAFSSNAQAYFHGRVLYGLVGYQNAQAAILAIGIPPALALGADNRRLLRVAGAGAAVLLCAGVLLTESRGGLLALGVGVLVQIIWSRNGRVAATALVTLAAAGVLITQLRHVDRALFAAHPDHAVRVYVLFALAAAAAAAVLVQIRLPQPSRRVLAALVAAAVCALGVVGSMTIGPRLGPAWSQLTTSDAPPNAAPGSTRLVSLSLNGRREAWRVALGAAADHPFLGGGPASFALRWTEKRRLAGLYIIQPHSIELELLSELGVVGLAAFLAFVVLAYRGIARSRQSVGGVAAGVISVVLIQASYDWTWSFPGLIVPALLMLGAAGSGGARRRAVPAAAMIALIVVSGAAIAAPYLAHRQVDAARAQQVVDPGAAWSHAQAAAKLDPWDEEAVSMEAAIAASVGKFALAAHKYHDAAALASQPWVDYYQEALAWQRAGHNNARRLAACRAARAQNPLEPLLQRDQCD